MPGRDATLSLAAAARVGGLREALAAAVARVNAAYVALPEPRPDVGAWGELEEAVDAAIVAGDLERGRAAIEAWEAGALRIVEGARR